MSNIPISFTTFSGDVFQLIKGKFGKKKVGKAYKATVFFKLSTDDLLIEIEKDGIDDYIHRNFLINVVYG